VIDQGPESEISSEDERCFGREFEEIASKCWQYLTNSLLSVEIYGKEIFKRKNNYSFLFNQL